MNAALASWPSSTQVYPTPVATAVAVPEALSDSVQLKSGVSRPFALETARLVQAAEIELNVNSASCRLGMLAVGMQGGIIALHLTKMSFAATCNAVSSTLVAAGLTQASIDRIQGIINTAADIRTALIGINTSYFGGSWNFSNVQSFTGEQWAAFITDMTALSASIASLIADLNRLSGPATQLGFISDLITAASYFYQFVKDVMALYDLCTKPKDSCSMDRRQCHPSSNASNFGCSADQKCNNITCTCVTPGNKKFESCGSQAACADGYVCDACSGNSTISSYSPPLDWAPCADSYGRGGSFPSGSGRPISNPPGGTPSVWGGGFCRPNKYKTCQQIAVDVWQYRRENYGAVDSLNWYCCDNNTIWNDSAHNDNFTPSSSCGASGSRVAVARTGSSSCELCIVTKP